MTLSRMPGGIGMFFSCQGVCSIVGMMYGEKYESLNLPFSDSSNAMASSFRAEDVSEQFLLFRPEVP